MPASKSSIVLAEAAKLVEQGWCQGVSARDSIGEPCGWNDRQARSWCARGAIHAVALGYGWDPLVRHNAEAALREEVGGLIAAWNDEPGRKMADVAAALRMAAIR